MSEVKWRASACSGYWPQGRDMHGRDACRSFRGVTFQGLLKRTPYIYMLLLPFAFHDLMFCLSSQLKAACCARCSSEMPPSKQVNGHSFTICLMGCCSPQS